MKMRILRVLSVAMFAAAVTACTTEELDGESIEGSSLEPTETVVVDPAEPSDELASSIAPQATTSVTRYYLEYGSCHTFDYLREQSNSYCRWVTNNLNAFPVDRHYTYGCTGWWGSGAKKVWFSCATHRI